MSNEEKKMLNDEVLAGVSGGLLKASDEFTSRRDEFEKAWKMLGLDGKQISGMRMATAFDDWELANFTPDALTFLKKQDF